MSGTVRILAISIGAAVWAALYFIFSISPYFAVPAGVVAFALFPICAELLARQGRIDRLARIVRRHRKPPG